MSSGAQRTPTMPVVRSPTTASSRIREDDLRTCQRRMEYLGGRLQSLAVELGDGQGAVWLKENMWFLTKPAKFVDDVLFGVGKICSHLVSYLTLHKQKLTANFPFKSYISLMYEIGDVLGIVRDMLIFNPAEKLSVKHSQIDLFWTDCTPFLFIFEEKNHLILKSDQIPVYLHTLLDLVPTVIQVGLGMYCSENIHFRGFECFAEMCIRLSKALVETGEFLTLADRMEPVIVPFLRQWVLYALELVQQGVKAREQKYTYLTPSNTRIVFEKDEENGVSDETELKSPVEKDPTTTIQQREALKYLAPLKVKTNTYVRTSCQPYRWLDVANTKLIQCPNESRKSTLEDICLRENQKLVSDIFFLTGTQPRSWKGVKIHCPLIKRYDELRMVLFVKVKKGEQWLTQPGSYEELYNKGYYLTFDGTNMDGFVAVEERPMVTKEMGAAGGQMTSDYDPRMEVTIPRGIMKSTSNVTMMIHPPDRPRERQYRESCPGVFSVIKSTSNAVEIDGATGAPEGSMAIKIPFEVLRDAQSKILVLKYNNDNIEIGDESMLQKSGDHMYTVQSHNGGTLLASVDPKYYESYRSRTSSNSSLRQEMEVILGKKQLCKLLILVEHQTQRQNIDQCIFCIVCAEKYRADDVLKQKSKVGLVELPNSQSPDRLLKQADEIKLEVKGQVTLDEDIPADAYTLTYLEGSDNYFRFPVNLSAREGKLTFIMRLARDNSILHTFFYRIEDLLALIGKASETKKSEEVTGVPVASRSDSVSDEVFEPVTTPEFNRDVSMASELDEAADQLRKEKEAALKILSRNSLVILARYLSMDEGQLLGAMLDMRSEKVGQIYKTYRHSVALASFTLLYEWRGRKPQPELAERLIRGLENIDRKDLARVVKRVKAKNKMLDASDFDSIHGSSRTGRRS